MEASMCKIYISNMWNIEEKCMKLIKSTIMRSNSTTRHQNNTAEVCLEPSQTSTMELFWKNSFKLNAEMFGWILKTPLTFE